jgi:hypothetical protein
LTYSTICVDGSTSSHHSSDFAQSDHLISSAIDGYFSLNNGPYGTHDTIPSAVFSNGPPSIPRPHQAEAFNFGTSDLGPNLFGISPEESTDMQPPTSDVPTPLPVHVMPDLEAQMALAQLDRPIGTRRKKSKPFECRSCGRQFSRKTVSHRHCKNPSIHRKQMSVSNISRRRFDLNPDLPHRVTTKGEAL